ncbi:hypothetical protein ACFY04_24160 [Streptomyces sp. NPDC001549]|uniref:hypothetical protein n=1 Tax=Streptomyces sp. NPDC001549 TaxID=3364586 RepID=UPI0036BCC3CA
MRRTGLAVAGERESLIKFTTADITESAGQHRAADAAISWMTPPGYVRRTLLPAMAKGAAG